MTDDNAFWRRKALAQMSPEEWESLCDGCGKCCLLKLEDEDTGAFYPTDVACYLLDGGICRCGDYQNRKRLVPDCVVLTPQNVRELGFMPSTCAYRLLAEGKDLPWWHHLVSGDPESVHQASASARHRSISEKEVPDAELEDHIVKWAG